MGRTNIASGGTELNVFAQLAEPSKKDGVWIKTEESKYKYDEINFCTSCDFMISEASLQLIFPVIKLLYTVLKL